MRVDCVTPPSARNHTTLSILLPLSARLAASFPSPPQLLLAPLHPPAPDPDFPLKPLPLCTPCFLVVPLVSVVVVRQQREIVLPHRRGRGEAGGREGEGAGAAAGWGQRKTCASGSEGCRSLTWRTKSEGHNAAAEVQTRPVGALQP